MNIAKLFITTLLLATSMAFAEDLPPTKTFEVTNNTFRMASTVQGTVGLKQCDDCDYHRLRVTARTQYMINGRFMKFEAFKEALARMSQQGEFGINVTRDEISGTVARIFIYE